MFQVANARPARPRATTYPSPRQITPGVRFGGIRQNVISARYSAPSTKTNPGKQISTEQTISDSPLFG